jgi:hypothetical protein
MKRCSISGTSVVVSGAVSVVEDQRAVYVVDDVVVLFAFLEIDRYRGPDAARF